MAGRPKGAVNKITRQLKDAILEAGERAGNDVGEDGMISYLHHQARENPHTFMSLVGKVLPMTVAGTGANGELQMNISFVMGEEQEDEGNNG